ncbi:MAG: hypothetical protein JSW24_04535 [Dehalococcoidia bacterium]|nr:MAG: hypothetical protein JSW24_04535 [Dehalococcoidia bacterium]
MKNSEFENILDECLERLDRGETLEQCLQSYPEQAAQLEPLLQMAQAVRKASAILPRSEFKARARYEFRSALRAGATKKRQSLFSLRPRWAVALMVVSILLIVGGGTAVAASNSMPNNPLYPVKLAAEQVQLTLTPSNMGKARLCAMLADRRVAEIICMADKGDVRQVEILTQRLDERLEMLAILVSVEKLEVPAVESVPRAPTEELAPPPAPSEEARGEGDVYTRANGRARLRIIVAGCACNHPAALRAALGKAPESAKPALRRAIFISEIGYERALAALD